MRIQSGICIELNHDRSIFLMKNGQFVTGTPASNTSIGEETIFYPFEKKPMVRWQPIIAPIIAAVAALALFLSVWAFPTEEAFGYVQIQINPGVELGINEQHEVVSIRELNSDGQRLIHQLGEWENRPLSAILNRMIKLAFTEKTKDITITAVEEDGNQLEASIKKIAFSISAGGDIEKVAIHLKVATKKQWRQSKEEQVPVGKLIEKSETLKKEQQPDAKSLESEPKKKPVQKEQKEISEPTMPDTQKETNNKNINESNSQKELKPTNKKEATPPEVEKKKETTQPQKTPMPNNQVEKPSNQPKNLVPEKKKESVNPPLKAEPKQKNEPKAKPEPKQKPAEKIEKRGPENKQQENRKATGQQKEKKSSSNNHKPENKKESEPLPGQPKKQNQNPGKKQLNGFDAKGNGNPAKEDNKKQNQGKE